MPDQEQKKDWQRFVPRLIRHDYVRKLIAIFLTAIIYIAVLDRLSTNREIPSVNVPLKTPAGFVIKDMPTVRLSVTGSQSKLKTLKPEDFTISDLEIKPENYKPGQPYVLQLTPENFHGPLGVSIVSVTPETIQIPIDKIETKAINVKAVYDTSSPLPQGYKIKNTIVKPQTVNVTAPSMILRSLKEIKTEPIKLNSITKDFDTYKKVVEPHPEVKVFPQEVMVTTEIIRTAEEKTITDLKINIMHGSNKEFGFPEKNTAAVTLSASSEVMRSLNPEKDINVYVFVPHNAEKGTQTFKIHCVVDKKGVSVLEIIPKEVKVTIQ